MPACHLHGHRNEGASRLRSVKITREPLKHLVDLSLHVVLCFLLGMTKLRLSVPMICGFRMSALRAEYFLLAKEILPVFLIDLEDEETIL